MVYAMAPDLSKKSLERSSAVLSSEPVTINPVVSPDLTKTQVTWIWN